MFRFLVDKLGGGKSDEYMVEEERGFIYPFAAYWSAMSWTLLNLWPSTSVMMRMALSVLLSSGYFTYVSSVQLNESCVSDQKLHEDKIYIGSFEADLGKVGIHTASQRLQLASSLSFMLDTNCAAPCWRMGSHNAYSRESKALAGMILRGLER